MDKSRSNYPLVTVNRHTLDVNEYHKRLYEWALGHLRKFPWRETEDPYHILVAEMMLRRTRAEQVVGVFVPFVENYPDAAALADAIPEEVAKALYSLGLAWRVPAFQAVAKRLVEEFQGAVPSDYEALLTLPGIGDYVASAVCSFAYRLPFAVIDTNTVRVVGRLFDTPTHAESRRNRQIRYLIQSLLSLDDPRTYNYTVLDLAATICVPSEPKCNDCPLVALCATGQKRLRL